MTDLSKAKDVLGSPIQVPHSLAGQGAVFSLDLSKVTPDSSELDVAFLRYYLESPKAREHMKANGRGVTVMHLRAAALPETPVPLPPLEEQRRIVDILEGHLSRLEVGGRLTERSRNRVNAMRASIYSAGLQGRLVRDDLSEGSGHDLVHLIGASEFDPARDDRVWPIPKSWAWSTVGDLFEVSVGSTPSRSDQALWGGELPWVSSGEVAFCRIDKTRETIVRSAAGNPRTRIHPPGTVLLAMIGEGRTRGQAAVLDVEAAHNQNCASIRVSDTPIVPEYVYAFLRERYQVSRAAASGGNQLALNRGTIQRMPIPVPPLATQRGLVAALEDFEALTGRIYETAQRTHARSVSLRCSLLARAFSGDLTASSHLDSEAEEPARV